MSETEETTKPHDTETANQNGTQQARQAFLASEDPSAADQSASSAHDVDALTRRLTDEKAEEDVDLDDALAEKARASGVEAAKDASRIAEDLTTHNP